MKKQTFIFLLMSLLLVSCGAFEATSNDDHEDASGDGGGSTPQNTRDTQFLTAEEMPYALNSQMFRDPGTKIYKYVEERAFYVKDELPSTLQPIPDKQMGDMNALINRPNKPENCGITFDGGSITIDRRIADCIEKNSDNARAHMWNGQDNGVSGEGIWKLVAHKNERSVWLDVSTGLIWSPPINERAWDYASGNVSESEQICNGANDTAEKDYFLGIQADEAAWRLPTRNDFLQADLNGSRFVLSLLPEGDDTFYWTANYVSSEASAWAIQHNTGILVKRPEGNLTAIRCVGNVIKFN